MNTNKVISIVTAALVLFLAGAAFVLSYDALYHLSLANGITPWLAWLWPLTLDAVMIAASLAVLRGSLVSERTWYQWALVILFTILSVSFNVLHAADTWLARSIFALPPLVVFLAFELLVSQIRSAVRRRGVSQSLEVMTLAVSSAKSEVAELNQQADDLSARRDTLQAEIAELRKVKRTVERESFSQMTPVDGITLDLANSTRREIAEARKAQVVSIIGSEPSVTYPELAQRLGVSLATVKRDVAEMIDAGKVRRNGHGLEPVSLDTLPVSVEVSELVSVN